MLTIGDPQPPLMDELDVLRTRNGVEVMEALWVAYDPPYGPIPAKLTIARDWFDGTWAEYDSYWLVERESGRVYALVRDPMKLLSLPPGGDRRPEYEVTVGRNGFARCECRGFHAAQVTFHVCKHVDAVRWLVENGLPVTDHSPKEGDE